MISAFLGERNEIRIVWPEKSVELSGHWHSNHDATADWLLPTNAFRQQEIAVLWPFDCHADPTGSLQCSAGKTCGSTASCIAYSLDRNLAGFQFISLMAISVSGSSSSTISFESSPSSFGGSWTSGGFAGWALLKMKKSLCSSSSSRRWPLMCHNAMIMKIS